MTTKNTFIDYLADLNLDAYMLEDINPYDNTTIRNNAEALAQVIMEEWHNNIAVDDSLEEEILASITEEILLFIHDNYPHGTLHKQYSDFYDYIKERFF